MDNKIDKSANVLSKLLRIHYDHVAYYRWASNKAKELSLKAVFSSMATENEKNALALEREIGRAGDNVQKGHTAASGILVRIKEMLTRTDRKSILDSCADGEDTLRTAYQEAISSNDLTMQTRQLVRNQQSTSKALYEMMMTYRNGDPISVSSGSF
jgi:uncharacterized protein (TIGR02284 family)